MSFTSHVKVSAVTQWQEFQDSRGDLGAEPEDHDKKQLEPDKKHKRVTPNLH